MPPRIGNTKVNYYKRALKIIELREIRGLTYGQIEFKFKLCRSDARDIYLRFRNRKEELLLWLIKRRFKNENLS